MDKKKITVINGSHRINGNCQRFAERFKDENNDFDVVVFNLHELSIGVCNGCLKCEDGAKCPIHDDYDMVKQSIMDSEVIVFATPSYFDMPSSLLMNLIDRTNDLCGYFEENQKNVITYIVGQTDEESLQNAYFCLQRYYSIMNMQELGEPIFNIARMPTEVPKEINETIRGRLE